MSCPGDGIGYFSEPCKGCKNCVADVYDEEDVSDWTEDTDDLDDPEVEDGAPDLPSTEPAKGPGFSQRAGLRRARGRLNG